jgi:hypothetical protein
MAAYQELFDGLRATTAAGGPTHHLANYTVLTNPFQAIAGGWQVGVVVCLHSAAQPDRSSTPSPPSLAHAPPAQVEVLWVVNQQQTAWEAALPQETGALLQQGRAVPESGSLQRVAGVARRFAHDALGTGVLRYLLGADRLLTSLTARS